MHVKSREIGRIVDLVMEYPVAHLDMLLVKVRCGYLKRGGPTRGIRVGDWGAEVEANEDAQIRDWEIRNLNCGLTYNAGSGVILFGVRGVRDVACP